MPIAKRFIPCIFKSASEPRARTTWIFRDLGITPNNEGMIRFYTRPRLGMRKTEKNEKILPTTNVTGFPGGLEETIRNPHNCVFFCTLVRECQGDLHKRLEKFLEEKARAEHRVLSMQEQLSEKDKIIDKLTWELKEKKEKEKHG